MNAFFSWDSKACPRRMATVKWQALDDAVVRQQYEEVDKKLASRRVDANRREKIVSALIQFVPYVHLASGAPHSFDLRCLNGTQSGMKEAADAWDAMQKQGSWTGFVG